MNTWVNVSPRFKTQGVKFSVGRQFVFTGNQNVLNWSTLTKRNLSSEWSNQADEIVLTAVNLPSETLEYLEIHQLKRTLMPTMF